MLWAQTTSEIKRQELTQSRPDAFREEGPSVGTLSCSCWLGSLESLASGAHEGQQGTRSSAALSWDAAQSGDSPTRLRLAQAWWECMDTAAAPGKLPLGQQLYILQGTTHMRHSCIESTCAHQVTPSFSHSKEVDSFIPFQIRKDNLVIKILGETFKLFRPSQGSCFRKSPNRWEQNLRAELVSGRDGGRW